MIFDIDKYGSRLAIIADDGTRLTYDELAERVVAKAKELQKGVLQFCLCKNSIESIVEYLACLEAGSPVVLLDATKDQETIENLRKIYKPGETKCHPVLALCLTTSGSTGSPKLVRLTKRNILANAESIAEYLHIDTNERPITMLPMYYSYGLSIINSHLLKGATILLTDKTYAQREFWNFLKENEATSMSGVPYTWELLRRLRFMRMDLPSVKTMTQAGGKLNAEIAKEYIQWAKSQGKRFIVMYGQTEATARMSYLPWERAEEKYASIGVAIPGGQFSLAEDGELIYQGENVSLGYAECAEDLMKGDENHGVLHTGDMARVDEDGFYYITGRKKRFVKVWGNRCNLDQVEQLVKPITTTCACAGVDDHITVFVTKDGLEKEIKDLLAAKTGLNPIAFAVKVIESIPVTASGKIDYQLLQAWI
jgi:acyl-CoA synthetase (AMP-forming)/AMP-acid ligase II